MVMKIGSVVLLLHLAGGMALAAPQSPLPVVVQIQSVTHDTRTPLSAGQHLTVRLRGTPGGVAKFHVAGIAMGVGMREIPSQDQETATYVGTYVVRPRDAARAAAITAKLKVGEQELVQASDRPVIIDARPPEVTTRLPQPDARLTNLRPNIVLRFYDGESSVDPDKVKLVINGQDVTSRTAITDAFAAYTPAGPFRPGPVRVQAVVRDRAGNATRVEWAFVVSPPRGLITSVTVNSAAGLKPGDYLTVVMAGAPAGQASLTIKGSPRSIPMRESAQAPGTYVGMHPISFKDQGSLIHVSTRLRKGNRSSEASAVAPVPVFGQTPQPINASPSAEVVAGEQWIEHITVRGRTRPAFHVMGLLSARVESPTGSAWTPLLATSTSARPDGSWQLSLGPLVPGPRAALFLTLVAIDPLGQRSPPITLALGRAPTPSQEAAVPIIDQVKEAIPDPSPGGQQVLASPPPPPPPTVASAGASPCSSGRIDPATGRCVVTETGTEDSTGARDGQGAAPPSNPPTAGPPEGPNPPANPKPKPPGNPKPKPPDNPKP